MRIENRSGNKKRETLGNMASRHQGKDLSRQGGEEGKKIVARVTNKKCCRRRSVKLKKKNRDPNSLATLPDIKWYVPNVELVLHICVRVATFIELCT